MNNDPFETMTPQEFRFHLDAYGVTPNTIFLFQYEQIDASVFDMLMREEDEWLRVELGPESHDYHQLRNMWIATREQQAIRVTPLELPAIVTPPNTPPRVQRRAMEIPPELEPPALIRATATVPVDEMHANFNNAMAIVQGW